MNPFTRPAAGSYKALLVQGLLNIGRPTESIEFEKGSMKLAIVSTITGNVRTFKELTEKCISALATLPESQTRNYYMYGLENREFVPASSNGAYVYDENDPDAVAFVKSKLEQEDKEVLHPYFDK